MRKNPFVLSFILLAGIAAGLSGAEEKPKYLDPSLPIEKRINDLLPRMTVEEKIIQISDSWGSKGIPRLKIPTLLKTEGLHGQSYSTGATIFPQAIAMGATFDLELIAKVGKLTAIESKAAGIRSSWSPVLDVARDARWGRVEETYGEDPYLVSRMGVAWITAFETEGMIAVPKHFAGHGEPLGGRDSHDAGLSERLLREIHLPPFRAAFVEAHAGGVMAAYSTWNGVPDNASVDLLHGVLRQEWGFDGYVVSDCDGPNHFIKKYAIVNSAKEAAVLAARAGVNMECGQIYHQGLADAIEDGLYAESELDDLVRPILRAKFKLGLFERPGPSDMQWSKLPAYDSPEAREVARDVAIKGSVLLKNDKKILPLAKSVQTIAVIGPNADVVQTGDYSGHASPGQLISVLKGIQSRAGTNIKVRYAAGLDSPLSADTSKFSEAVTAAKGADVAVVVVGDSSHADGMQEPQTTGENNDGATLDFPGAQRQLIQAIEATGTPVILVIVNGKPFTLPWEAEHIEAIMVTWYAGEEAGNAAAAILFGDANPSGRLPITWPRHVGQVPLHYNYLPSGRGYKYYDMPFEPQYRFGFGLSYTQFNYSNLQVLMKDNDPGFVTVTAEVENKGDRDGEEIVQLYLTDLNASVNTRVMRLEGFKRVSIKKGEKKTVSFSLTPDQLSLFDVKMIRRVEPGTFRVHVGGVCPPPSDGGDDHKLHVKYKNSSEGVSKEFEVSKPYHARFLYTLNAPAKSAGGEPIPVTLTVKNSGNLTDVTQVKLFGGNEPETRSFELAPGETKTHVFHPVLYRAGETALTVVAGDTLTSKTVSVNKSNARLDFRGQRMKTEDGVLKVSADVQNTGGESYSGSLVLKVDGAVVGEKQALELQPGERQHVALSYTFPMGGLHKVQINDLSEQQLVVPAGLALGLQNTLIYLKLDEGSGTSTRNEVTGTNLTMKGSPNWVEGKSGKALELTDASKFVETGNTELYRKAFTLSAWVKIKQLADERLALFGGQAPMGAGQDNSGTTLHAGVSKGKLYLGFYGQDIAGDKQVPSGDWVNLTYTYNPVVQKGALYINGVLDKEAAQKAYTGPLETIGNCPVLAHGNYLLDEVAVVQKCLSALQVKAVVDGGLESLQRGEFVSNWRPAAGAYKTLETWTEVPSGAKIAVTVEIGDKEGKVIGAAPVDVAAGHQTYALSVLPSGSKVRVKAQLDSKGWGSTPVLRGLSLKGSDSQNWGMLKDWNDGKLTPGLRSDFGQ